MARVINKHVCECCGQTVSKRQISIYSGMVKALIKAYKWCNERGSWQFNRKELEKNVLKGNSNMLARWGDWPMFYSPMVYKPHGKGSWALYEDNVRAFLLGEMEIPIRINKTPDGVIEIAKTGGINKIQNLDMFFDEHGEFIGNEERFEEYIKLVEWESKHNPIEKKLAYMRIMEYIEEKEWQIVPPILEEVFCIVASGTELSAREDTTSSTQTIPGMINVSTMEYAEQLIKDMEEDLKIYFGV